jgi:hypothetical protein
MVKQIKNLNPMKYYKFFKSIVVLSLFIALLGCEQYEIEIPEIQISTETTEVSTNEEVSFIVQGKATHYVIYFGDNTNRSFFNTDSPIVYSYKNPGTYEVYVYAKMVDRFEEFSSKSNTIVITVK